MRIIRKMFYNIFPTPFFITLKFYNHFLIKTTTIHQLDDVSFWNRNIDKIQKPGSPDDTPQTEI